MKKFVIALLFLLAGPSNAVSLKFAQLFADQIVRGDPQRLVYQERFALVGNVSSGSGQFSNIFYERKGGDSESSAVNLFIPINAQNNHLDSSVISATPANVLPLNGPLDLRLRVAVDVQGGFENDHLYALFRRSAEPNSDFQFIGELDTNLPSTAVQLGAFYTIDIAASCQVDSGPTFCSAINDGSSTQGILVLAIGREDSLGLNLTVGDEIASETVNGLDTKLFFNLRMSARVPGATPTLIGATPGDEVAFMQYTGATVSNFMRNFFIDLESSSIPAGTYRGGVGRLIDDGFFTEGFGIFEIGGLTNNETYSFVMVAVDRFFFSSRVSNTLSVTPRPLAELIPEGCFLVSASFPEGHFILSFFRSFRDQILLVLPGGKDLVSIYYQNSPFFARHIKESRSLKAFGQFFFYLLWFLLSLIPLFIVTAASSFLYKKGRNTDGRT